MYYEHFRISGEPFSLTPDPAFLFLSGKHREAMAAVQYGLQNGRGFITLIGEVGTGKTTILYSVLSRLGPDVAAAYVPYAAHPFDDLLTVALKDLGKRPARDASRLELLEMLQRVLVRRDEAGQRTALVIDEAQSLSDSTFEELRQLSNFETYTHKLLQIVLVGQPELQVRLRQQNLRQLQQRVSVRAIINPLDGREMEAYILHRLNQVGGDERLFEPAALQAIIRHARGIPRRANILCHNALLFAFGHSLPVVTVSAVREAIGEMDERTPGWLGRAALQRLPTLRRWSWRRPLGLAAAGAALLVAGGAMSLFDRDARSTAGETATVTAAAPAAPTVAADAPGGSAVEPPAAPGAQVAAGEADAREVRDPVQVAERGNPDPPVPDVAPASAPLQDAPPSEPIRTVSIPRGGSILAVARELYGKDHGNLAAADLLDHVRRLNPGLRDVNVVKAGATVRFPSLQWPPEGGERPAQ